MVMKVSGASCPICKSEETVSVLELADLPIFCNIQLDTHEEALRQPTGDMHLDYCKQCSHIFNSTFDESLLTYSEGYENSLHFSGTFSNFAEDLAKRLVENYQLHGKRIIDIGCGKGDFLSLICDLGGNYGFGFDKSYEEGRVMLPDSGSVQYYRDHYSERYSDINPDLVTCRHVLEHIPAPNLFLQTMLSSIGQTKKCSVYFEVPNALFIVRDLGIWDLIYEHCQYFTAPSLHHIFSSAGVDIDGSGEVFGGQFLFLDGSLSSQPSTQSRSEPAASSADQLSALITGFSQQYWELRARWKAELQALKGSAIVWGAGSKGVTFLNQIDKAGRIEAIVDVNPHKQGKFIPVSGHEIIAPADLGEIKPSTVFIMNPLYKSEIERELNSLGLDAEIRIVE